MSLWPAVQRPSLVLGSTGSRLMRQRFAIGPKDIYKHTHVIGVTGQGKSKAIVARAAQLPRQGAGVAVIDPHGDLALDILGLLHDTGFFATPAARERLWYIDFNRSDRFLPFNVLNTPRYPPHVVANHVTEVCKRVWPSLADGAAPQFENTLKPAVVTLVENGLPLTALSRLLTDKPYRDALLARVADPQVVHFFHDRFDRWGRDAPAMIESTLRRAFLLTFSPTLRYSLGQRENLLDFRRLMDEGVSLICNLGGLDEETQRFVGSLLTVGFEEAALSREDIPEADRRPYFLLIDEFSLFSATSEETLARVLSLARKYKLFLTLAHQTFSQLSARMLGALQNCVEVAFRLGPLDAELMAPRFTRLDPYRVKHEVADPNQADRSHPVYFTPQEQFLVVAQVLTSLRERECLVKTGGRIAQIKTLTVPPVKARPEQLGAIREWYAEHLLTPAANVRPAVDGLLTPAPPQRPPSLGRREPARDAQEDEEDE